jgi:hypothetical protein
VASVQIIAWKNIPSVIEARDGAETVTRQLSERFQALIDAVAMQLGVTDSDAYLEAWSRTPPEERPGTAEEAADTVAAEVENRFPEFIAHAFRPS